MADSSQYNLSLVIKAQNEATKEIEKINGQVSSIGKIVGGLAISKTLLSGMKSFANEALTLGGNLEQAEVAFSTMLGSADEADKMLKDLSEFAKKTPFELTGIRDSAKQLMAYGFSAEEILPTLKNLGDVASGLSVPISQLALPMGQVRVAGKLMTQDLKQFQNAGVDLVGELSKNLGKSKAEIQSMISAGQITSDMVSEAFQTMTSEGGRFENLMERQSGTFQGMMSNLNDSFDSIKETIGRTFIPVLENILSKVAPIIEAISERIEENPELATTIASVVAGAIAFIGALSGLNAILPLIKGGITLLTSPIGLVAGAIILLATARANNRGGIQEKTQVAVEHIERIIGPRLDKLQKRRSEHGETVMIYVEEIFGAIADTIGTTLGLVATIFAGTFQTIESGIGFFKAFLNGDTEEMQNILMNRAINIDKLLTESFGETRTNIKNGLQQFIDDVIAKFTALKDRVVSIVQSIKDAWNSTKDAVGGAAKKARDFVSSPFKAGGGDVYSGQSYIVGEKGPELFVPNQKGSVVPTNQITNNNGIEININGAVVRNDNDIQAIADEITRRIKLEKNFGIA